MARLKLDLKTREQFAELSLHEKNAYLQDVAGRVAEARGEAFETLDKDALSRLRRFYMRRSFADLKLEEMPSEGLQGSLRRLAEGSGARFRPAC